MTVGCAGGYIYDTFIPIEWSEENGTKMTISISGLQGGHSGAEIQNQLGNAHKIMGLELPPLHRSEYRRSNHIYQNIHLPALSGSG